MKNSEIIEYLADCLAEDVASSARSYLPSRLDDEKPWPEKAHRWCLSLMRAQFHGEHDVVRALEESDYSAVEIAEKSLPADPRGVLTAAWERHCDNYGLRKSRGAAPPEPDQEGPISTSLGTEGGGNG